MKSVQVYEGNGEKPPRFYECIECQDTGRVKDMNGKAFPCNCRIGQEKKSKEHPENQKQWVQLELTAVDYKEDIIEIDKDGFHHREINLYGCPDHELLKIIKAKGNIFDVLRINGKTVASTVTIIDYRNYSEHDIHGKLMSCSEIRIMWK